jgi:hypothetical protein
MGQSLNAVTSPFDFISQIVFLHGTKRQLFTVWIVGNRYFIARHLSSIELQAKLRT